MFLLAVFTAANAEALQAPQLTVCGGSAAGFGEDEWYHFFTTRDGLHDGYDKNDKCNFGDGITFHQDHVDVDKTFRGHWISGAPLMVYAHGFSSNPGSAFNIFNALKSTGQEWNFIAVNWSKKSKAGTGWCIYDGARRHVQLLGPRVAEMINQLPITDWSDVHLVGHSLGSHTMSGAAWRLLNGFSKTVGRVTVLDPAGPGFRGDNLVYTVGGDRQMKANSFRNHYGAKRMGGVFVDVWHSNGEMLPRQIWNYLGDSNPLGNLDIYINNGRSQPFCKGVKHQKCSHTAAKDFFAAAIAQPEHFNFFPIDFADGEQDDIKNWKIQGATGSGAPRMPSALDLGSGTTCQRCAHYAFIRGSSTQGACPNCNCADGWGHRTCGCYWCKDKPARFPGTFGKYAILDAQKQPTVNLPSGADDTSDDESDDGGTSEMSCDDKKSCCSGGCGGKPAVCSPRTAIEFRLSIE